MNKDKLNIITIPFHDYKKWINEGFRTRDAHIYEHFKKNKNINKILIINRPVSLAECVLKRKKWNINVGKIEYKKNGVQLTKLDDNTWCLDFYIKDFFKVIFQRKNWWFTAFNYKNITKAINEAQNYLKITDSILFLENPMAIGAVKKVHHSMFVFDAIDNWIYHPQMKNKNLIKKNYQFVKNNANIIFTVSESLKKFFTENKNTYWVSNGVDTSYFKTAISESEKCKKKITVGYVGKIQDRVDFNLVEKCLRKFPNVNFVFAGPILSQKKHIKHLNNKYKNISFVGDIHYNNLPKTMKEYDICIIPHKVNDFTNSMNPLKLYEYIAAGKIVVTTKIAGLFNANKYLFISSNNDDFTNKLEEAIEIVKKGNINYHNIVKSIPKEYLWETITDKMINLIREVNNE